VDKVIKDIFPNGEKEIKGRTNALLRILDNKVDEPTARRILMQSSAICYLSDAEDPFDKERLRKHLAGYCLQYFNEKSLQEFYILLVDTVRKPKESEGLTEMFSQHNRSNPQATVTNEIQGAVGEYGLEVSNPVPVNGIAANNVYLGRLRTPDGMPIQWSRVGSTRHKDINKPIDNYDIFNSKGKKITNIYISPYHLHTSTRAPKGFKIVI
jgi:hypothetical protein